MRHPLTAALAVLFAAPVHAAPSPAPATTANTAFTTAQWQEYHCLTLSAFEKRIPPCAVYCEEYTFRTGRDGCHPDDFPCHCRNSERVAKIIEPCIFPWLNHTATCTREELGQLQAIVTDSCTFFNATGNLDNVGCGLGYTLEIAEDQVAGLL